MSNFFFIKSKLSGSANLVVDILGDSRADGAPLDLYPQVSSSPSSANAR